MQNKGSFTLIGVLLALVLFLALNLVTNATLRSARLDLTEDRIYTLDEGSKAIARELDEPIHLYFYFSRSLAQQYPELIEYADRIEGVLREYERASDDNIRLSVIEPEPFSEEEDRAVEQGIQGLPLEKGDVLYFGLVGTSSTDARETIPFFALDEAKQRTLEYDLSKLIWSLSHPNKKRVGILTALSIEGGGGNPMMGQQGEPRWGMLDQLEDFFEVEVLPPGTTDFSEQDVLVLAHPRDLSPETLYAIDQWALAGKPVVAFVDPHCDVDPGASDDPTNPMSQFTAKKSSDLEPLFTAWGIDLVDNKVVCDRKLAVRQGVRSRDGRSQTELPVVFFLQLDKEDVNQEDPITRLVSNLLMVTPGSLRARPDATTTFTPLLSTSEESQEVDSTQFQFMPEPQQLLANLVPGYEKLTLGARVTGNVKSAYPDGKPGTPPPAEGEAPAETGLKESTSPLNVVVFTDADMLNDRLWLRQLGRIGQQVLVQPISENMDLLRNAIESVSGGQQLMSIRMRGQTSRPFTRVQELQRASDQRFLARQQELERKLQDAERRLSELQKAKTAGSEELVTAEQRKEEESVREEFVQTRRDLRDVRHQLHKDIENLGLTILLVNTALMPAIVCLVALGLAAWRLNRRSSQA